MNQHYYQEPGYVGRLYAQAAHITKRGQFLKRFANQRYSQRDLMLRLLGRLDGLNIADIGAGNCTWLAKLSTAHPHNQFTAVDIVWPADVSAVSGIKRVLYDGVTLAQSPKSWDVVFIMHMLYHLSDPVAWLRQIPDLLAPGGRVMITTKSAASLPQLEAAFSRVAADLGWPQTIVGRGRDEGHFANENGLSILGQVFTSGRYTIREYVTTTQLWIDDREALLEYILSTPRYQPSSHGLWLPDSTYRQAWMKQLGADSIFFDTHQQVLYDITSNPRV